MFDFYKDHKLQFMDRDYVLIVDFYSEDNGLTCADLQDAKNQIDRKLKDMCKVKKKSSWNTVTCCNASNQLAPSTTGCYNITVPCPSFADMECKPWPFATAKQEGTTPMRYTDNNSYASASIQSAQSDTAVQRDYLLKRLASADYPKEQELRKLYNLYVDNTPKTYADMIAIIKAGTYTIDPKVEKKVAELTDDDMDDYPCYGPMHGIIWPGPKQDYPGFTAASVEKTKQYTTAKDAIMIGDAAAGLAAIQAFEAWLPTPATPAQ